MSKNIRIVFILLTVVLVFFLVMIFRFYRDVETAVKTNVQNEKDQIVVPSKWNSMTSVLNGRYIVSVSEDKVIRYGVIDQFENIIIPVIYKKIVFDRNDSFFICSTENNKYVLTDENGKALFEREWDSYLKKIDGRSLEYDGNYIELQAGNDVLRFCSQENSMSAIYIDIVRELCGFRRSVTIRGINSSLKLSNSFDYYCELVDNSINYIFAMFNSDIAQKKKLIIESEYHEPSAEKIDFRGGDLRYINTISPFIELRNGSFAYSCNVSLMYAVPEKMNFDGTFIKAYKGVNLKISMKREPDGSLRISRVEADDADITKMEIPAECFDPAEVPETTAVTEEEYDISEPSAAVTEVTVPAAVTEIPAVTSVSQMPVTSVPSESTIVSENMTVS